MKTAIKEKYSSSNLLFELQAGRSEMYLIETSPDYDYFNELVLIWGDYVANVWEEKFEVLSDALARMALLVHTLEREDDDGKAVMFGVDSAGWVVAWNEFVGKNTFIEEGVSQ